jgi:hypothetical protein
MIEAKAFRIFIWTYSLLKSECLSVNNKLTLRKALIRSVMIYACAAWEFRLHVPSLERFQYSKHKRPAYRVNSSWAPQAVDHHRAKQFFQRISLGDFTMTTLTYKV